MFSLPNSDITVDIRELLQSFTRGSATEAVTSRKVPCNRNFFNLECIIQAKHPRVRVPTCQMEMELSPFLAFSSLKLLAFCPISGRTSTDSAPRRNLRHKLKLHKLLETHSTLRLMTASVAVGLQWCITMDSRAISSSTNSLEEPLNLSQA
jgi:hypothetical protein